MELFIPSLAVLFFAAIVCFFILPRMSPYVLGILSLAMFSLGVWQHYSMFPYEYRASMVTNLLQQYSGFIMVLGVIFIGVVGALLFKGPSVNAPSNSILPAMPNIFSKNTNNPNNSKGFFNLSGNSGNSGNQGISGAIGTVVSNVSKNMSNLMKPMNEGSSNNLVSASFKVS
jgi:predicted PurR-regulated permease PerM